MSPDLVFVIARIAAVQARVAGMEAFNESRRRRDMADGYDEGQFYVAEKELMELADAAMRCKS